MSWSCWVFYLVLNQQIRAATKIQITHKVATIDFSSQKNKIKSEKFDMNDRQKKTNKLASTENSLFINN